MHQRLIAGGRCRTQDRLASQCCPMTEEQPYNIGSSKTGRCEQYRRAAVAGPGICVRPALQQQTGLAGIIHRPQQRCGAGVVPHTRVCAHIEKEPQGAGVAVKCGVHQGSVAAGSPGLSQSGARLQQPLKRSSISVAECIQ